MSDKVPTLFQVYTVFDNINRVQDLIKHSNVQNKEQSLKVLNDMERRLQDNSKFKSEAMSIFQTEMKNIKNFMMMEMNRNHAFQNSLQDEMYRLQRLYD